MTVPECCSSGQVLQVSWIKPLWHIQAQFPAGLQENVDIILEIKKKKTRQNSI